jgi:hypothetical protein
MASGYQKITESRTVAHLSTDFDFRAEGTSSTKIGLSLRTYTRRMKMFGGNAVGLWPHLWRFPTLQVNVKQQ